MTFCYLAALNFVVSSTELSSFIVYHQI